MLLVGVCLTDLPLVTTFMFEAAIHLNLQSTLFQRFRTPLLPVFHGCPMPKHGRGNRERTCRLLLTYFHPWVAVESHARQHVPVIGSLAPEIEDIGNRWSTACKRWMSGQILTDDVRQKVQNFLAVTRTRPQDKDVAALNSDEAVSDVELKVQEEDLDEVLKTKPGGRQPNKRGRSSEGGHYQNAVAGFASVQQLWDKDDSGPAAKRRKTCTPIKREATYNGKAFVCLLSCCVVRMCRLDRTCIRFRR